MLLTTFRTERDYPRIVAYVAWFDHTRTALALYPGRYEPPNAVVRGPMSVPRDQRWRLLATFNGGFTYIDGGNGSAVNGQTNEPLKDGLATLVGFRNGTVNIVDWKGGPDVGPNVRLRPPEPAPDHLERQAQPGTERQLTMGGNAPQCGPGVAYRSRHRSSWRPRLRRRGLPDRDHTRADPPPYRCSSRDALRHQPGVAHTDHV
jgi:hypothetical protein